MVATSGHAGPAPTAVDAACGALDPERLRRAMAALTNGELANAPLRRKLLRVVALAAEAFRDCYAAATVDGHEGRVCTNSAAYLLDQAQDRSGDGPAAAAAALRRPVRVDRIADCAWTDFRRAAAQHRVLSSLSLPLLRGDITFGMLNLYSPRPAAFAGCEAGASALAGAAANLLGATPPRPRT